MPEIISVLIKRRKLVLVLTTAATLLALVISLLRPKEYLATATVLPVNSAIIDKARLFNNNIEGLYPELGSPDEFDRIEGTAKLDTLFLAVTDSFRLTESKSHPSLSRYEAAMALKKNSFIRRSAYGELKISVWDRSAEKAAALANAVLKKLNDIHQHVQNRNNTLILQTLKAGLLAKQKDMDSLEARVMRFNSSSSAIDLPQSEKYFQADSGKRPRSGFSEIATRTEMLQNQLREYQEMIGKYELAVATSPQILIPVENARPALSPDKPNVLRTTLFAFGASLLFSFLLALLLESRPAK